MSRLNSRSAIYGYSQQRAEGYASITLLNALDGLDLFIEWRWAGR